MGSPKALLRYRGETFLDRTVRMLGAHCAPVIVVLGAGAEEIRAQAQQPATFVMNANYRSGQTSSMQAGLRAVPAGCAGVLFTLVDHPAVDPETIAALAAEAEPAAAGAGSAVPGRARPSDLVFERLDSRVPGPAGRWSGA